ncbi:nuclear transport factor 2 family protein [Colwelliaceae bacterium 6441]
MNYQTITLLFVLMAWAPCLFASERTAQESQAVRIVDQQLNAYNSQDIEAFVATYHPEVEIYDFPNQLKYSGRDKLRQNYQGMFANLKCLNASSKKRIILNNTVIDHELAQMCTTDKNTVDTRIEVIAIYEVEAGLIKRVMFQP